MNEKIFIVQREYVFGDHAEWRRQGSCFDEEAAIDICKSLEIGSPNRKFRVISRTDAMVYSKDWR